MRTELFSLRQSNEEIKFINKHLKRITTALTENCGVRVLYKTEINADSRVIKKDIAACLLADNPPELYVYMNALSTKQSYSFRKLFTPVCEKLEGMIFTPTVDSDGNKLYPNIKVYPINDLGSEYPAYCFAVKSRKFLVLPRFSLIKGSPVTYLCKAVNRAKDILTEAFDTCPDGVVYLKKPRKGLLAMFDKLKSKLKSKKNSEQLTATADTAKPSAVNEDSSQSVGGSAILEGLLSQPDEASVKASAEADTNTKAAHNLESADTNTDAPDTSDIDTICIPANTENTSHKASDSTDITDSDPSRSIENIEIDLSDIDDDAVRKAEILKSEFTDADSSEDTPKQDKKKKKKKNKKSKTDKDTSGTENTTNTKLPKDSLITESDDKSPVSDKKEFDPTENNPFFPESLRAEISEDELVRPANIKEKKSFKNFILGIIPHKGDDKREVIRKSIILAAVIGFITGAVLLLNFYVIAPYINSKNITEVQDVFYSETVITDDSGNVIATEGERNWAGLKKINKEIVGWIKIDKTKVDYPVLHHKGDTKEDQFYLDHNYKKQYTDYGSIFVDYRCKKGVESKNLILHGHNMGSDNSMFASLLSYARVDGWTKGNTEFYKKTPIINFDTPKENGEYVIFAVLKVNVSNSNEKALDYMMAEFESDAQFMNHVYNMKQLSYLTVDVPINENDKLLTLSTCSYEYKNARTVVIARKLRPDEDVSKYIKKAKAHTPVSSLDSTFSSELKAGNIKWYDGKGNLKGKEEAEYLDTIKYYTVTFVDTKGKPIDIQTVKEGESATAPTKKLPRKAATEKVYYTFAGWDTDFTNVTKDLTVKPVFNSHPRPTVTSTRWPHVDEETTVTAPPQNPPAVNPPSPDPTEPATAAAAQSLS